MANSKSFASQLDQELQCEHCYQMFRDPRMLPCQHTFCLECLENVSKLPKNLERKRIICPYFLCMRKHDLPREDDVKAFPKNMVKEFLLEIKKNRGTASLEDSEPTKTGMDSMKRSHNLPIQEGAKGFPENMLMKSLLDMKTKASAPPPPSDTTPLVVDKITGMEYSNEDMFKVQSTNAVDSRKKIRGAENFTEIKVLDDADPVTVGALKHEDIVKDWFITPNYKIEVFFLGFLYIQQAVMMIFTGIYLYDQNQGHQDGSLVIISLIIEGSILLLLPLTFPLFYRLSLCCQKNAPVLARFIKNIGWVLLLLEIVAFLFTFLCGTVFVLVKKVEGCNEEEHCHRVPQLVSLVFHLVKLVGIALLGFIRLCYCMVTTDF